MKEPAQTFKALADETRLRILALLLTKEELCVCDIISALKLPQSTVSRHLAYLRKSGLVNDRRCGLWMYYSIAGLEGEFQAGLLQFLRQQLTRVAVAAADSATLAGLDRDHSCD